MTLQYFVMPRTPQSDTLLLEPGSVLVTMNRPVKGSCHYCFRRATTRDHVVAQARNGRNAWWNLVPSCEDCNTSKGSKESTCVCIWCRRARFLMQQQMEWD